jgi:hypothetical protein
MIRSTFVALGFIGTLATTASANPRPLPFSYPYETLPQGKVEVEQYMDFVPVRVEREKLDGTLEGVWSVRSVLTTELEWGITDRLEAGFYFQFRQGASGTTPFLRFDGVKQRLRYRFAETGELPVDIGIYLEIAEFHNELEFEEKLLLSKRLGDVVLVANLWVEQEWYFQDSTTKYIYNPTVGASYEITPRFHVGLEYWARGRFDDTSDDPVNDGSDAPTQAHHYLGPTFLYQQGSLFISLGAYVRLDDFGDSAVVNDPFGKLWIRSIIGVEL